MNVFPPIRVRRYAVVICTGIIILGLLISGIVLLLIANSPDQAGVNTAVPGHQSSAGQTIKTSDDLQGLPQLAQPYQPPLAVGFKGWLNGVFSQDNSADPSGWYSSHDLADQFNGFVWEVNRAADTALAAGGSASAAGNGSSSSTAGADKAAGQAAERYYGVYCLSKIDLPGCTEDSAELAANSQPPEENYIDIEDANHVRLVFNGSDPVDTTYKMQGQVLQITDGKDQLSFIISGNQIIYQEKYNTILIVMYFSRAVGSQDSAV